jgi:CRP/FNR family transcriptional regulator
MKTITDTDSDFVCDITAPCFSTLSQEEADLVKASKTQVLFRKGDNLTKQGAFASYILFVVNGYARQYIEGTSTKSFNVKILKPGDFVGLSTVFEKNIFNSSSIAITECRVFLIEKDTIAKLIMQNGLFAYKIIKRHCEHNSDLLETLKTSVFKQMNGRLAQVLLYLNGFKGEFPEIFQHLTRKDIADFAGISTESTVKLLKTFESENLIKLEEKDIVITDINTLNEISKRG